MHGKLRKETRRVLKSVQDEALKRGLQCIKHPDLEVWEFVAFDGGRAALSIQGRRIFTMVSSSGSASSNMQVADTLRKLVETAAPESRSIDLRIDN